MRHQKREIAITGIGVMSPLGKSSAAITRKLLGGDSGVKKFAFVADGPEYTVARVAAPVKMVLPNRWTVGRATAMALAAADMALLQKSQGNPPVDAGLGLIHASSYGNLQSILSYREDLKKFGVNRASPMQFPNTILHAAASFLSLSIGAAAFNVTLSGESVSGLEVLETARQLLDAGSASRVLCVASEELCPDLISVLQAKEELDWELPDPFGEKRAGYVPGEAAVALLVEFANDARRAGRPIYCWLRGHGYAAKQGGGCKESMRQAMHAGNVSGEELGCIVASANGSRNDAEEAEAIATMVGSRVYVTSTKSAFGECGAVSSFLSLASMVFCASRHLLPATRGRSKYDPKLPPIALLRQKQKMLKRLFLLNASLAHGSSSQLWEIPPRGAVA